MSKNGNLAARQWTSSMFGLCALILAAAACFALSRIPQETQIPIEWAQSLKIETQRIGVWGLFIAPAALLLLGLSARFIKGWLPRQSRRRRVLWYILVAVILILAALQYVLVRDAFSAAALA
ncbi:hypothetical protein [Paracoccus sp. (in: a-proteobacteria)]|uniref:hypothetical protein n=1 Tax=Paracoccus sp. TaxID=267 RepID=UPI00289F8D25|nr:hypothetical protein [Paracoccus sp. (in: a-proteobacteria)]